MMTIVRPTIVSLLCWNGRFWSPLMAPSFLRSSVPLQILSNAAAAVGIYFWARAKDLFCPYRVVQWLLRMTLVVPGFVKQKLG